MKKNCASGRENALTVQARLGFPPSPPADWRERISSSAVIACVFPAFSGIRMGIHKGKGMLRARKYGKD